MGCVILRVAEAVSIQINYPSFATKNGFSVAFRRDNKAWWNQIAVNQQANLENNVITTKPETDI